ncbi:hypothetical protein RYX36_019064 [Vicia faba]
MPNGLDCTVNEINVTPSDNVAIPQELVNSSIVSSADVQCGWAANELTNNQYVPVIPLVCNGTSNFAGQPTNLELPGSGLETPIPSDCPASSINTNVDVDMVGADAERNQSGQPTVFEDRRDPLLSTQNTEVTPDDTQAGQTSANNDASGTGTIDPTFLEALPEDLRAEVLAPQQAQSIQPSVYAPPSGEDIDPEFLAALPPDIQAEVLVQQRAQRVAQQAEGHLVDMDNASIIATFPADLREEVLLTSSEAVLSALPAPLLTEAQILRDRAMSHYQARNLFGSSHRLNNRRNGLGFVRRPVKDQAPTVGIYLPCHDIFRNWFEEYTAKNAPVATTYVPLVAGSLARSLACATCYPIELAKTRMQAFKETQIGKKPPGVYQTLLGVVSNVKGTSNSPNSLQGYRALWTGMGAQLARDVPFSAICWSTLEPTRRKLISLVGGDDASILSVLGANFSAGVVAGTLAVGATCPLDVAKTRRQIEMDHVRALKITLETCELNQK